MAENKENFGNYLLLFLKFRHSFLSGLGQRELEYIQLKEHIIPSAAAAATPEPKLLVLWCWQSLS